MQAFTDTQCMIVHMYVSNTNVCVDSTISQNTMGLDSPLGGCNDGISIFGYISLFEYG